VASSKNGAGELTLLAQSGPAPALSVPARLDAAIAFRATASERALARACASGVRAPHAGGEPQVRALAVPRDGRGVRVGARARARFLIAGARGFVASLWPVDDRAAARTMEVFDRGLLREGLPPPRAQREAKLALRRGALELGPARGVGASAVSAAAAHAFFWAPCVHIGLAP
jgi:hypothetical protein